MRFEMTANGNSYITKGGQARYNPRAYKWQEFMANNSEQFDWKGIPFPGSGDMLLQATETLTGVIKVSPRSFLMSMTGWCSLQTGFQLSVYDKEANYYLIREEYDYYKNVVGGMDQGVQSGQRWMNPPYVVLGKGELQISVTNLSKSSSARLQVLFQFAERRIQDAA